MLARHNIATMRLLWQPLRLQLAMPSLHRARPLLVCSSAPRSFSSGHTAHLTSSIGVGTFESIGLSSALIDALGSTHVPPLHSPSPVQRAVIPRALQGENMIIAGSTGSGKTLAFTLPVLQSLAAQEQSGYQRQPQRPRALILVPTRELARQVLSTIKSLSHTSKVSSCAVLGGEQYGLQKRSLSRVVDVVREPTVCGTDTPSQLQLSMLAFTCFAYVRPARLARVPSPSTDPPSSPPRCRWWRLQDGYCSTSYRATFSSRTSDTW